MGHVRGAAATAGAVVIAVGAVAAGVNPVSVVRDVISHQKPRTTSVMVARVIDGDTFVAVDGGGQERVRILGMDAPEVAHDGEPAECGADEATEALKTILGTGKVTLVTDSQQPDRDTYGRLLRYVDVDPEGSDGEQDVTEEMILRGAAPNTSRAGSHDRHQTYAASQREAQKGDRGLWAECR